MKARARTVWLRWRGRPGVATDAPSPLVARHDFPAKDLLAYVRANKEKATLATAGLPGFALSVWHG